MNKPESWWGNPNNAQKWIDQVGKHKNDLTYTEQPNIVYKEVEKRKEDFNKILEVGSGTGHLIGKLSEELYSECWSVDINAELINYITKKYEKVNISYGDIIDLPFDDNSFDLVYTYQVLQHVHPDNIRQALNELLRVTKKELWLWEGIGKGKYGHRDKTHNAHNGSWVYHICEMVECYDVSTPQNDKVKLNGQRLYKIKI